MNHSSKRNPCPICQRSTDDKCRWNDTRIYCYVGDSFAPPLRLALGDKIKIAGEQWRLFSYSAGFSQNSYGFALHENDEYRFLTHEDKRLFRKNCIKLTRLFLQKEKTANAIFLKFTTQPSLCSMTIEDFYANKALTGEALQHFLDFDSFTFANKRYLRDSGVDLGYAKGLASQFQEKLDTIYEFEMYYLGNAKPESGDLRPVLTST